jgi:hypothetical protein
MRNAYNILVGKPVGKRPGSRLKSNIKVKFSERGCGDAD